MTRPGPLTSEQAAAGWLALHLPAQGAVPVAARLLQDPAPQARYLALPALATERGFLDPLEVRAALTGTVPAALTVPPLALPAAAERPDIWMRRVAALLLAPGGIRARPPATAGIPERVTLPALHQRVQHAMRWARAQGRPLTFAAAHWAAAREVQGWVDVQGWPDVTVTTLEDALHTLAAASVTRLRALADMLPGALALDGLHRLDARGTLPVSALIADHAALGLPVLLTGPFPHAIGAGPLDAAFGPELPRGRSTVHADLTQLEDLIAFASHAPPGSLVLTPSRQAALTVQAALPGSVLHSRSRTAADRLGTPAGPPDGVGAALQVSTWTAGTLHGRPWPSVVATPAPLPVLADAALLTAHLHVLPTLHFPPPGTVRSAVALTMDALAQGQSLLDPLTHERYWAALTTTGSTDAFGIQDARRALQFQAVTAGLARLFDRGVQVFVPGPEAQADIDRAVRQGRMPLHSPFTVTVTPTSLNAALQDGRIERRGPGGAVLVWRGPYSAVRGVGLP